MFPYFFHTDLRVPLLVRGPGVMSNKTITDVNVNIDLAPTIIDMSGQEVAPHTFDGISFLPFIQEKSDAKSGKTFHFINRYYTKFRI